MSSPSKRAQSHASSSHHQHRPKHPENRGTQALNKNTSSNSEAKHDYDDEQASTNYKEAFSLFDKRGTGRVSLESLGDLLRACGQNPTLAEIRELEKGMGGDCELVLSHFGHHERLNGKIELMRCFSRQIVDFDSFQKVLNRPGGFRDPGEPEEYCRGFQVFDKDMTGFIGVGQLRYSEILPAPIDPLPVVVTDC